MPAPSFALGRVADHTHSNVAAIVFVPSSNLCAVFFSLLVPFSSHAIVICNNVLQMQDLHKSKYTCMCLCHLCRLQHSCVLSVAFRVHCVQPATPFLTWDAPVCNVKATPGAMEDIENLGGDSLFPSTQVPVDVDVEHVAGLPGSQSLPGRATVAGRGRSRGRASSTRSMSGPSPSQSVLPHKVRGPNWTEAEMLVLIGQKRIEWDGRHNCSQPSLAKFVYGTTAWKLVLAGCMSVVGFRERDADQLTNKWDGLIKDYKKLKDYIEGTGSANWWGMNREEKRDLCKTRKLPLEFSEIMYNEMENFVGKRQIFGRATDVVDSDRISSPPAKQFGRSPPSPRPASFVGVGSPATSSTTAPSPPVCGTPGDDIPGSTGRKRKAVGTDNLVDFVKDFNYEYLARVEAQEKDKRSWRTEVMALDTAREARIANKEAETSNMENKLYDLEVERTRNLGNMTSALLMLASSMDTLTRFCVNPLTLFPLGVMSFKLFVYVFLCNQSFACVLDSLKGHLLPSYLPAMLFPRSPSPLAVGVERPHPHPCECSFPHP